MFSSVFRMVLVRRERSDNSNFWPGLTMEYQNIPPQHWPFYAELRLVILQTLDPWWYTAGKPPLTSTLWPLRMFLFD